MKLNFDFNALANEFKNIDFENVSSWPAAFKALVVVIFFVLVIAAGVYVDTLDQMGELEQEEKKEIQLKAQFEEKQSKAVNLDAYILQMKEMEESFGTMLRQLPSKTEVAELLVDITQTGLASGLEFDLFKPLEEVPREFYAELPISVKVNGRYHQFGEFVSGVAALPRIVSLHDISVVVSGKTLSMEATAKTYRYLDEEEIQANKRKGTKRH